jgi:phosphoserine phosphatase
MDLSLRDFADTWFYSDSHNDLPLLSAVSRPVAVDPDSVLRQHAVARGWPVVTWRGDRG